ncbi:MAG: hypothetical protein JW854_14145 [Actinobacteria bacterium]|nr:hypothetical protein [Actinomycetota bacterium]
MKRVMVLSLLLMMLAVVFVGCGSNTDSDAGSVEVNKGGDIEQANAAACAANRKIISAAAQEYFAMEGTYPSSIQALVPGYLQSVPACPSGGTYSLSGNTATCSVHGQ